MLSPFSAHEIEIEGETFKTVEHAYRALRIKPGPEREKIKSQKSPMDAWREVVAVLLRTGERDLIKQYDTDYDWGTGADGTGKNMYGKLWMKLRDGLRLKAN